MPSKSAGSRPLDNLKIIVACSAKKMFQLQSGLEAIGGKVLALPLIEAREIEDKKPLDAAIASLRDYAWIVFTSAHGVDFFMRRWIQNRNAAQTPEMPKICAVGPATAKAVNEYGVSVTLIPERFVAEGVIDALAAYHGGLQHMAGCRVLLPRAKQARDVLLDALKGAGVQVDVVPCYETVRADLDHATVRQLRSINPDLMVITSSSTIRSLIDLLGPDDGARILRDSTVAVLGPVAAKTAEAFGKSPEIVPEQSTIASLIEAIRRFYSKN